MKWPLRAFILCLTALTVAGCRDVNVEQVTSRLRVGMNKTELDRELKGMEFLKEQTVILYPNTTEEKMRSLIGPDNPEEYWYPKDLANRLSFDGKIKVYSYLVKNKYVFANGWFINYLAVFFDKEKDSVVGWGYFKTIGEPRTWDTKF